MNWEDIARELAITTDSKIVLLVCDGLGGLPVGGRTELEAARKPNLDEAARLGACGMTDPVFMGITPGSGPAHLALFGYDPLKFRLGRGILEALGSGVEVGRNDVVARGNFATLSGGLVVDRRAGRIPTTENERLCAKINAELPKQEGVEITLIPGKEHRFVARFRAVGLADVLSDADPQKDRQPRVQAAALKPEAARTAVVVNRFLDELTELLKNEPAANTALLRGFSKFPSIPHLGDLYHLRPAAIANYPMYKGLAKLLGMDVLDVGAETSDLFDTLEREYMSHDFFYIHFKRTDAAGEDGNFEKKVAAIEEIDRFIPRLLALKPEVLVITSDHSTPALLHGHSWHPNPFVLVSPNAQPDRVDSLTEIECARGTMGRFQAIYAMPLMLAHALKLKKFGA